MTNEIPQYGLRAYALFFTKHGATEEFGQSDLDWIVGQSMKKKIFSLLLRSGWIRKKSRGTYVCVSPERAVKGLLGFKVPEAVKRAERPYAFAGSSAVEIWSDYSYVQRGVEKSPYFINVLKKDLGYWKKFFSERDIPVYVHEGATIGEYVILNPVDSLKYAMKAGFKVIGLPEASRFANANEAYSYSYNYMREKYGSVTGKGKRGI
ncbi:MAG: hypothetical protein KGH66_00510 [Candidatus Micrarchaeota archaeon]|nr:hypothetical protein [Candidatus Micrarchaeota archaeon]